jgi:hypothetical protein
LPFAAAQFDACCERRAPHWDGIVVVILGIVLLILGYFLGIHLLWAFGVILLVIGVVFWILGSVGRPVGGRRYWY